MAGSATNPEEEEDWESDVMPPPCPLAPGLEDLVSQLNQDPRAEFITDSGIGTTAMEEDTELNAVREDVELNAVREDVKSNAAKERSQSKMKLAVPISIIPVDQMI